MSRFVQQRGLKTTVQNKAVVNEPTSVDLMVQAPYKSEFRKKKFADE